jgi:hypothetical protein
MKVIHVDAVRRIGWSDIMRIHVAAIGRADRGTGRWVEAEDHELCRTGEGKPVESTEDVGKHRT